MHSVTPSWRVHCGSSWAKPPRGSFRPLGGYRGRMTTEARSGTDERAGEGFGSTSRRKVFLLYAALIGSALVVLQLMLGAGRHLHAPKAASGGGASQASDEVFWKLLLASLVVIV